MKYQISSFCRTVTLALVVGFLAVGCGKEQPAPATPLQPCEARPITVATVYAGPGTNYAIVGWADSSQTLQVTGMFYADNYPTWWRINFDGVEGWVDALGFGSSFLPGETCNPPVSLVDIDPLPGP